MKLTHKWVSSVAMLMVLLLSITLSFSAANYGSVVSAADVYEDGNKIFNVVDYGAVAGGSDDDSAAFQKALNAAKSSKGTVIVPRGVYTMEDTLTVPAGVRLQAACDISNPVKNLPQLNIKCTRNETDSAFITLKEGASIAGFNMYYSAQNSTRPLLYGWTIRLAGKNIRVSNIYSQNTWQFIDAGSYDTAGHIIDRCNAFAYSIGIKVDKCSGTGIIKDVHFWPFDGSTSTWVNDNATGWLLGYSKNEVLDGCFSIRYNIGFRFADLGNGAGNYTLQTSGADCGPTGILVEKVKSLKVTSGQFMQRAQIKSTNTGKVEFYACNFRRWSKATPDWQVLIEGSGNVIFDSCLFSGWDTNNNNTAAIEAKHSGTLTVSGCEFRDSGNYQVRVHSTVSKASIDGNLIAGSTLISNSIGSKATIVANANY